MIGLTFGIGDFLPFPKRVNLSLELGTIVWFFVILHTKFQLPTTPKSGLKTSDLKLSFWFPPPRGIGLRGVVRLANEDGGRGSIT